MTYHHPKLQCPTYKTGTYYFATLAEAKHEQQRLRLLGYSVGQVHWTASRQYTIVVL